MELRFPESEISYWAAEYENYWRNRAPWQLELALTNPDIVDTVQQQGYLDLELLKKLQHGNRRVAPVSLMKTVKAT